MSESYARYQTNLAWNMPLQGTRLDQVTLEKIRSRTALVQAETSCLVSTARGIGL